MNEKNKIDEEKLTNWMEKFGFEYVEDNEKVLFRGINDYEGINMEFDSWEKVEFYINHTQPIEW